jgi:hypothetical protein
MNLKKNFKWALPLALVITLIPVGAVLAVATVIDHFDTTQTLTLTWGGTTSGSNAAADLATLGGERDFVGNMIVGQSGQTLVMQSNNADDSLLNIQAGSSVAYWAEVQYDGSSDSPKSAIDYRGLAPTNLDLLGDRFIITIVFDDRPADIMVSAYTDADNWSSASVSLPGNVDITNVLVVEVPFSNFVQQGGSGPVDFADIGALTFRFDATNFSTSAGTDLTIHLIGVTDGLYRDFGDLPDEAGLNYDTLLPTGARHIVTTSAITNTNVITPSHSVILGDDVSLESDGQPSTQADLDQFDEGVVRTPGINWSPGTGGSLDITVSHCEVEPCYVSAWIDWNQDGDFGTWPVWDLGEQILSEQSVTNGMNAGITVPIPLTATITNQSYYVRVRISEQAIAPFNATNYTMITGEVEDFLWGFGPTAITLTNIEAQSNTTPLIIAAAAALLLTLAGGAVLIYKRSRT